MPQFKPFKGIRPIKEIAGLFSTKSVDNFAQDRIKEELETNPESFLHLVKPIWTRERITIKERHRRVRENFMNYVKSERSEEDKHSYYIYQLIKPNKEQVRAVIGLVNMHEYKSGKIKTHEKTLKKRVRRFADYLSDVHFHSEPVLLTYPHNQRVDLLMDLEMKRLPAVSFTDKFNNQHQLWQIENRLNLQQIKNSIEKYECFYIADGHHRMESSLVYTEKTIKETPNLSDNDPVHYTLAMLVSDKELIIKDYNRILKDLNGLNTQDFLQKLNEKFEISKRGENPFFPSKKHNFGLYLEGEFYSLMVKKKFLTVKGLSELDTYLFEEMVLKPILDIQDSRTDNRIKFFRGTGNIEGIIQLKNKVDKEKASAAFFFYPVVSHDLEKIADLGLKMPPKSTYIEPKPLTGLTIFQLKE